MSSKNFQMDDVKLFFVTYVLYIFKSKQIKWAHSNLIYQIFLCNYKITKLEIHYKLCLLVSAIQYNLIQILFF